MLKKSKKLNSEKMPSVHHIHVKFGKSYYTVSHPGAFVDFDAFIGVVTSIIESATNDYFRDKDIKNENNKTCA